MNKNYAIYDLSHQMIFSFDEIAECYEFSNNNRVYSYALLGLNPIQIIENLQIGAEYQLKSSLYAGRLNHIIQILDLKIVGKVVYCTVKQKDNDEYIFGALSVLKAYPNHQGRIWHDMQLFFKTKYLCASYLVSGKNNIPIKKDIVIEGKFITDRYAFFCELGYAFWGIYGFMGANIDEVSTILETVQTDFTPINILWLDIAQSQLMINNTQDESYPYEFVSQAQSVLENYCNLTCI